MRPIALVHLVRAANGLSPFRRFLDSYARVHKDDHQLVVAFKGFPSDHDTIEYERDLEGVAHDRVRVPDVGFDIWSYFIVARTVSNPFVCFLNSFSEILDPAWIPKMYRVVQAEPAVVVGATASWESPYTSCVSLLTSATSASGVRRLIRGRSSLRLLPELRREFDPFPNPHIRTNAFMLSRELMLRVRVTPPVTKLDALRFESGRGGLTGQIADAGGHTLVVGRDGDAYPPERWPESATFRSGEQRNLLVADNQTRAYEAADPVTKRYLERMAWGGRARP